MIAWRGIEVTDVSDLRNMRSELSELIHAEEMREEDAAEGFAERVTKAQQAS